MAIRYRYNNETYSSKYELRQAIFEKARIAFGEFTPELMKEFSITEEKYNPEDDMTDEELAVRVRMRRDSLISGTDYYILPDYPSTPDGIEAVKQYRQDLRDITKQSGFPKNVIWPDVPKFLCSDSETLGLATVGI